MHCHHVALSYVDSEAAVKLLSVYEGRYAKKGEKWGEDSQAGGRRLQTTQQKKM